ncbi:ROK family protein [Paenibacillus mendelii]|uniref:ROK family protein n=1 Tax=Paenibacillus mendelii TaxID=206163 RepID=A0ABV6JAU4_9BACL|nr:ROK family protein [Paenibacillus mendelii]MCQ6562896.1 ROK family protein [Paenibacillus mendelii]
MSVELAIGVDIGGTKIHFALADDQGKLYHQEIVRTEAREGAVVVLNQVLEGIGRMYEAASAYTDREKLRGIGIGSAGQIDFATGRVAFAVDTLPGWTGTRIKEDVAGRFPGLPVIVDNDVNVQAIAERRYGAARGLNSFVCLALGTGIGGAVVENGQLIRGTFGGAAELGHVSVNFNGPRCSCGNRGCIELYASGTGIVRLADEHAAAGLYEGQTDSRSVIKGWLDGEPQASAIMDVVITALSTGISGLIHTFNPQAVIIGGGVSEAGEPLLSALRREAALRTAPAMWEAVKIVPAAVGIQAGVIGAAAQLWHYS